jgi:hypothetical protein
MKSYFLRVIAKATSFTGARVALADLGTASLAGYNTQKATFCEPNWADLNLEFRPNSQSVAFARAH